MKIELGHGEAERKRKVGGPGEQTVREDPPAGCT